MSNKGRIDGLDILRGIAVGLVLLRHAWPDVFGGAGIVGVVIFFTLSGFLISRLLIEDLDRFGRVRYWKFYRNRAMRLLPALITLAVGISMVTLIWDPLHDRDELARTVIVALTYTANLPFDHGSLAIGHLWTLAVEEQFYIVWPVLLFIGWRRRRLRAVILASGAAILLASAALTVAVAPDFARLYSLPTSWSLAMVIGAYYALSEKRDNTPAQGRKKRTWLVWVTGSVLLGLCFYPDLKSAGWAYLLGAIVIGGASIVLIDFARNFEHGQAWTHPLRALGIVSYAAYLWNLPIVLWLRASGLGDWAPLISIALTITAATASWWVIEKPFHVLRQRLDLRRRGSGPDSTSSASEGSQAPTLGAAKGIN